MFPSELRVWQEKNEHFGDTRPPVDANVLLQEKQTARSFSRECVRKRTQRTADLLSDSGSLFPPGFGCLALRALGYSGIGFILEDPQSC